MYSQQVYKKCCSAMNVKNYACKNLHISIHAIIYINMGNKQTVIFCIARSNNWCLIPTASLDVYFSLSLICAQRQFTAPSWNSIRCAGNKVNWVYLCDCIQAFQSIWSPVLTGYFVSKRKKKKPLPCMRWLDLIFLTFSAILSSF